jgi:arsenate reductase
MAEGYLRKLASDRFETFSAGTEPRRLVHPMAVEVMAEDGVAIAHQRPKNVSEFLGRIPIHYLIVVCDQANASCPQFEPGLRGRRIVWPFDDPDVFQGSREETRREFRRVRDQIRRKIEDWLTTNP